MQDEWLAVARGLKFLSNALIASVVVLYLLVLALACELETHVDVFGGYHVPGWLFPGLAAVAAMVAFMFSRWARLALFQAPLQLNHVRFCAVASLMLELLGTAGIVGRWGLIELNIRLGRHIGYFWDSTLVISSILFWIAGKMFFQRMLSRLTVAFHRQDVENDLTTLWTFAVIAMFVGLFVAVTPIAIGAVSIVVLTIFTTIAILPIRWNFACYLRIAKSLRFSALREAVRHAS